MATGKDSYFCGPSAHVCVTNVRRFAEPYPDVVVSQSDRAIHEPDGYEGCPMLSRWLVHPLTRGRDIDAPQTTELRKQIICQKPFLRKVYEEWYKLIAAQIPCGPGGVLELGTGAGFLKKYLPDLITSDVFPLDRKSVV